VIWNGLKNVEAKVRLNITQANLLQVSYLFTIFLVGSQKIQNNIDDKADREKSFYHNSHVVLAVFNMLGKTDAKCSVKASPNWHYHHEDAPVSMEFTMSRDDYITLFISCRRKFIFSVSRLIVIPGCWSFQFWYLNAYLVLNFLVSLFYEVLCEYSRVIYNNITCHQSIPQIMDLRLSHRINFQVKSHPRNEACVFHLSSKRHHPFNELGCQSIRRLRNTVARCTVHRFHQELFYRHLDPGLVAMVEAGPLFVHVRNVL